MPAIDLHPQAETGGTIVVFGGFDSYVEEFLPMLATMVDAGHRVIAFEGPGQGGALEEHGLPMIAEWERPVAAVLDHYRLDDVTVVGESLGGGLVIRAAAFEPRISRVVSMDILDDEFEVIARQIGRGVTPVLRALLALRAKGIVNAVARRAIARKPVAAWGLQQGMHITGTSTAYDFLRSTTRFNTRRVSQLVTADVLLLAGADDHYVPLKQLRRQAANLVRARSVTTRTFTAAEQASNHCQVGNIGAAVRVIQAWLEVSAISRMAEKADAAEEFVRQTLVFDSDAAAQAPAPAVAQPAVGRLGFACVRRLVFDGRLFLRRGRRLLGRRLRLLGFSSDLGGLLVGLGLGAFFGLVLRRHFVFGLGHSSSAASSAALRRPRRPCLAFLGLSGLGGGGGSSATKAR